MSISYTKVESSSTLKKSFLYGAKEFVRVTIDRSTDHHLSLPADYKFSECFLTKKYVTLADRILNFPIRADDVWTVSFPKVKRNIKKIRSHTTKQSNFGFVCC